MNRATVSLSRRHWARILEACASPFFDNTTTFGPAIDALRAALAPKKSKPAKLATRRAKAAKREAKNKETATIYEAVAARAGGSCENCGGEFSSFAPAELDHMLGRGKAPQSVRNCWLICRLCHRDKTNNVPSAPYWFERMLRHARTHRHTKQAIYFANRLESRRLIDEATANG